MGILQSDTQPSPPPPPPPLETRHSTLHPAGSAHGSRRSTPPRYGFNGEQGLVIVNGDVVKYLAGGFSFFVTVFVSFADVSYICRGGAYDETHVLVTLGESSVLKCYISQYQWSVVASLSTRRFQATIIWVKRIQAMGTFKLLIIHY
jgi:hypothetical protein